MAKIHGREGVIKFATGVIAEVRTFKITEAIESVDGNSMSNPDWDETVGGRKSWSGEVTFFYDPSDTTGQGTVIVGDEGSFEFFPEGDTTGTQTRSGIGRIESADIDVVHDQLVEGSVTVKGVGALTAWTTVV